jgi:zinc/manganese transport system substrate-binding protein
MQIQMNRRHLIAPLAACLLLAGLAPITARASEPIQVTASFSILGDIVRAVGTERVKVTPLVGPDEDAHVFEPKPADAKTILQSRLVVMNGLGFEPWMLKLLKSSGYKGDTLEASKGVKPRTMPAEDGKGLETDPHAWQDPTNVIVYVQNIAQALTKLDPAGASLYQKNAAEYTAELKTLDDWAKTQMSSILREKRKVITSHDAFGYFAAHYNVTILAPQGVSTETEPSAKEVARLIRQIKHDKIKAVFMENMSNPKLISQIAVDTGVTLGPELYVDALSAKGDEGTTYLKLMRHNVTELVKAMQKN